MDGDRLQRAIDEIERLRKADQEYELEQADETMWKELQDVTDRLKTYDRWSTPGATIVMDLWRAVIAMADIMLSKHKD